MDQTPAEPTGIPLPFQLSKSVSFDNTINQTQQLLAADAQTSGGLLISMPINSAEIFVKDMNGLATIIGEITEQKNQLIAVNK